ncbi:hypothetical protein [Bailinhaonella thermotolerans]|uniref:Uncharacterized protein n=1 Tax=Bailinhaonella thermotolerans TaxID=1070861 RepID=A0A3A4BT11_9ACTN|nr:hypothetical protein [Bailinhaonella thermotolerans]RJL34446.1 hypothetical protein D5H75_08440 [Bailinhaonella thermotolerans]
MSDQRAGDRVAEVEEERFVTAAQISGPKTPPADRQRELWKTVWGEGSGDGSEEGFENRFADIEAGIGDDDGPGRGRRVWPWAVAGSAAVALVAVVVTAFATGTLGGSEEPPKPPQTRQSAPVGAGKSTQPAKEALPPLPRYKGTRSPVTGQVKDRQSGLHYAALGGRWQLDQRTPTELRAKYGFSTRQYVPLGQDSQGRQVFAHVMSGPLPTRLAPQYTGAADMNKVLRATAYEVKKRFYGAAALATKTAEQRFKVGGRPAELMAFEIRNRRAGTKITKDTVVFAAVDTGRALPAILYIAIPDTQKSLLPDINTIIKSIKP